MFTFRRPHNMHLTNFTDVLITEVNSVDIPMMEDELLYHLEHEAMSHLHGKLRGLSSFDSKYRMNPIVIIVNNRVSRASAHSHEFIPKGKSKEEENNSLLLLT